MATQSRLVLLLWLIASFSSEAKRSWLSIEPYHTKVPFDITAANYLFEDDPFSFTRSPTKLSSSSPTDTPTQVPSESPTALPTSSPSLSDEPSLRPSPSPSRGPTPYPTRLPTLPPTRLPTASPSSMSPSESPTSTPTEERFPENDPPVLAPIDSTYFNYNEVPDALYGPGLPQLVRHNATLYKVEYQNNAWKSRTVPDDWYWKEFDEGGWGPWADILSVRDPTRNRCGRVGKQSPIDVRENGAKCEEHHQIRTRRGDYPLGTGEIEARIEPNKLRLYFQRRPCGDPSLLECSEPDPPHADFPNNWGGYTDVLHVDFKLPSEHLIQGERFDGEMQIFHIHPTRRRTPVVVSMMKATQFGYNYKLQEVINAFQFTFTNHAIQCATRRRLDRQMISKVHALLGKDVKSNIDYSTYGDFSTDADAPKEENATQTDRRLRGGIFTPHHEELVRSIHFFAYDGSLTEPPCSEFVSWFITDEPMTMSFSQLDQLKNILFNHVNPNCERTSVHHRESVARPIQDTFNRPVWRCTEFDFGPDPPGYN